MQLLMLNLHSDSIWLGAMHSDSRCGDGCIGFYSADGKHPYSSSWGHGTVSVFEIKPCNLNLRSLPFYLRCCLLVGVCYTVDLLYFERGW